MIPECLGCKTQWPAHKADCPMLVGWVFTPSGWFKKQKNKVAAQIGREME